MPLRASSRRGWAVFTAVVAALICASSAQAAQPRIVPPAGTWDGLSAGDLLGDGWARV